MNCEQNRKIKMKQYEIREKVVFPFLNILMENTGPECNARNSRPIQEWKREGLEAAVEILQQLLPEDCTKANVKTER